MDEEWVKKVFLNFYLFSFDFPLAPQAFLNKHNLMILQTAVPLTKWFGMGLESFS